MSDQQASTCPHQWEIGVGGWGIVIGVSKCKKCGATATKENTQ